MNELFNIVDLKISEVLPLTESAEFTGHSRHTISQYCWTGKLPSFKIGHVRVCRITDLDALKRNKAV
jgi:hypothetical protein